MRACTEDLTTQLLCNPHSAPASSPSSEALAELRRDTLALLNADGREYEVVITSGATAALKLVAESFPWTPGCSLLAHPAAVHNSVLGMRGPALAAGAAVQLVRLAGDAAAAPAAEAPAARPAAAQAEAQAARVDEVRRGWVPAPIQPVGAPIWAAAGTAACAPALASGSGGHGGGGGSGCSSGGGSGGYNLLVLPAECNFTGDREPVGAVVQHVRQHGLRTAANGTDPDCDGGDGTSGGGGRWLVLLDAAKACSTAPPDLSAVRADFVVLSFYKIFGHPTGLGALVARRDTLRLLSERKAYWGGGTVEVAVADRPYQIRRPGPAGLEDGTPPFTSIAAARHGFAFLARLGGLPAVSRHANSLARWLASRLASLRHANGAPVAVLYGRWCRRGAAAPAAAPAAAAAEGGGAGGEAAGGWPDHGPTLSFNLLRHDGSWVGYGEVGRLAALHGLHLRTGCFCNPGACGEWLGLGAEEMIRNHSAGHVCWDEQDIVGGKPTGAVRVSLGAVSSFEDVYSLLQLVVRYFVDNGNGGGGGSVGTGNVSGGEARHDCATSSAPCAAHVPRAGTAAEEDVDAECRLEAAAAALATACQAGQEQAPAPDRGMGKPELAPNCGQDRTRWDVRCVVSAGTAASAAAATAAVRLSGASAGEGAATGGIHAPGGTRCDQTPCGTCDIGSTGLGSGFGSGMTAGGGGGGGVLRRIVLYPVKSCAGQAAAAWPVGPTGLLYDREWALVDDGGKVLTLKQCPRMALIRPTVDLTRGSLTLVPPPDSGLPPLELPIPQHRATATRLRQDGNSGGGGGAVQIVRLDAGLTTERVQVCGDTVCSDVVDACHDPAGEAAVRRWFARALGAPCRVVQQRPGARKVRRPTGRSTSAAVAAAEGTGGGGEGGGGKDRGGDDGGGSAADAPTVGFANDGQYLLVSEASLDDLRARLAVEPGSIRPAAGDSASRGGSDTTTAAGAAAASSSSAASTGATGQTIDAPRSSTSICATAPGDADDLLARLRPNLVVSGFPPYAEDGWAGVALGPLRTDVLGACPRCELLQVNPRVGVRERRSPVLLALAQYRRTGGRLQFGVLLAAAAQPAVQPAAQPTVAHPTAPQPAPQPTAAVDNEEEAAVTEEAARIAAVEEDEALPPPADAVAPLGSVEWLRRRFGRSAVVAVGDPVVPVP